MPRRLVNSLSLTVVVQCNNKKIFTWALYILLKCTWWISWFTIDRLKLITIFVIESVKSYYGHLVRVSSHRHLSDFPPPTSVERRQWITSFRLGRCTCSHPHSTLVSVNEAPLLPKSRKELRFSQWKRLIVVKFPSGVDQCHLDFVTEGTFDRTKPV